MSKSRGGVFSQQGIMIERGYSPDTKVDGGTLDSIVLLNALY